MEIISNANKSVLSILNRLKQKDERNRWMHYCLTEHMDDGVLIMNMLTKELILLTEDEYQDAMQNQLLKDRWFVVPENLKEKELAYTGAKEFIVLKSDENILVIGMKNAQETRKIYDTLTKRTYNKQ